MGIGERIAAQRDEKGLSQAKLALLVGVGVGSISRYERNILQPRANALKRLADALGCTADFLIGNEDPPKRSAVGSRR
jgi:transcriptional regulator with XRE-family HTH domain